MKFLAALFMLPWIASCAPTISSEPLPESDESIVETSEEEVSSLDVSSITTSEEEDIYGQGYELLRIDGVEYYRLIEGLYVNKTPGVYQSDFALRFAYNRDKGDLYFNYNGETPLRNSLCHLSPFEKIDIYENVPTGDDEIPMSTSVDEILDSRENRCVSDNYINNVQNPGNYAYFHNACVVDILFAYEETETEMSLSYLVDPTQTYTLPLVFLSMPYRKWFGSPYYFYNNIHEEPDMRVHLEFFDPNTRDYWQRNSKIKLGGGWSKGYPQRTMNLNFKKDENGNKNEKVTYPIFGERKTCGNPEKDLSKHIRFRLHNNGNCFESWSGFNDAIIQRAMFGTNVATTAYRPCLAYLNGEYWGIMSLREHYCDYYLEQNYGVKDNNVTMFELKGDLIYDDGSEDGLAYVNELKTLVADSRFNSGDATVVEAAYAELCEMVDMDSLIDMLISEFYACNWDFVGNANNLKMWRVMTPSSKNYEDGKWRFCLHDLDFAFTETTNFMDKNANNSYNNWGLIRACMRSATFRSALVARAEYLALHNLSRETLSDITYAMYEEVDAYKADSGKRWGQPSNYYGNWRNYYSYLLGYYNSRSSAFVNQLKNTLSSQYGGY